MMAPWLAAPRSREGLAALPCGFSVVVVLTCMVVPLCDAVGHIVVPVVWDEAFDEAGMVVPFCGEVCIFVEPGALVTFAFCVVGVIELLEDSFRIGVHCSWRHVPFCISADPLPSFAPSEYKHGVPSDTGAVLFAGSVLLHANVQFA